jgi:DNA-binding phage protein
MDHDPHRSRVLRHHQQASDGRDAVLAEIARECLLWDVWRERLRETVERSGTKHAAIAWNAGIAPETLSRILSGDHRHPRFETVVRITHACGETVGWLLAEDGFALSAEETRRVRTAAVILERATKEST